MLDINIFRNLYKNNEYNNIDMNNKIYQKFYVQCLYEDNSVNTFIDCTKKFKFRFPNNTFLLNEESVKKIKFNIQGGLNNFNIEDLCNSIKSYNQ